ncbi:MAG: histidine kinase [Kiritimatiellia bacterium]
MCSIKNRDKVAKWARRYQAALRRHLMQKTPADLQPAVQLGEQAVELGLETLSLARHHEKALASLVLPLDSASALVAREEQARLFFTEMLIPVEKTSDTSLRLIARVNEVTEALRKCKEASSASARLLKENVVQRQEAEGALALSARTCTRLVEESNRLNALLRDQTHEKLVVQEKKRKARSIHLQDVVAQSLLAIDLRLLALRKSVEANTEKLSNELDETERMVRELQFN